MSGKRALKNVLEVEMVKERHIINFVKKEKSFHNLVQLETFIFWHLTFRFDILTLVLYFWELQNSILNLQNFDVCTKGEILHPPRL